MTKPDFAGAESPAHPKAEQEFREEIKLPNPPLLGASRDEIARIIRGWDRPEPGYRAGPGTLRAIEEADRKADQILALLAFAGLLTPSLSHEEEDHTVSRNSGTTCRGAEPAAPANARETSEARDFPRTRTLVLGLSMPGGHMTLFKENCQPLAAELRALLARHG